MSNIRLRLYDQIILSARRNLEYGSYSNFVNTFEKSVTDISFFLNKRNTFKFFNLNGRTEFEIQIRNAIFSRISLGMENKKEFIENFYFTYYANENEIFPSVKYDQLKFNHVLSTALYIGSDKIFDDITSIKKSKIKYFVINFLIYYIEKNKSFEHFNNNSLFIHLLEKFNIKEHLQFITKDLVFKTTEYRYFLNNIQPFFENINNKNILDNF